MMSREEFAKVQQQMVDMNDENLAMRAQIKSIKQSLERAEPLRQAILQIKSYNSKEEKQYQEDMGKIQSKISYLTNQLRNYDDPNRSKSWDEKRLIKLQSNYNEELANLANLSETIKQLNSQIDEFKSEYKNIDENFNKFNHRIKNLSTLMIQIKSFGAIQMKISELESDFYNLTQIKKQNAKRISNLTQAKSNLSKSDNILEDRLNSLTSELSTVIQSSTSIQLNFNTSDNQLSELKTQENDLISQIMTFEVKNSEKEKLQLQKIDIKSKEKVEKELLLKKLLSDISELSQMIDQSKLERNIRINKQASLLRQLSKSIKDKVTDITRLRSSSPEVQKLIERQEKEWIQKQQLQETFEKVSMKHKELTNCVSRKALIVNELHDWLKTVPPCHYHDPISELDNCYNFALEENRARAEAIVELTNELNSIEEINRRLKEKV